MILHADAQHIPLGDETVQCCVTSPPYWGLRKYDIPSVIFGDGWVGQLGLEPTIAMYIAHIVSIFREVWRVLRKDGTAWVNLGDSYAGSGCGGGSETSTIKGGLKAQAAAKQGQRACPTRGSRAGRRRDRHETPRLAGVVGLKPKDLCGIPWRVALALQADGWWLRSDIVWSKPNPMPESVTDRPTRAHEYVFLLAKSERYFYDVDAIREPHTYGERGDHHRNVDLSGKWQPPGQNSPHNGLRKARPKIPAGWDMGPGPHAKLDGRYRPHPGGRGLAPQPEEQGAFHPMGRNKRSVWTILTQPFPEAHFATMPEALVEPCILAGSRPGELVLDPFHGSGTVGRVAESLGRLWVGLDLGYHDLAKERVKVTRGLAI